MTDELLSSEVSDAEERLAVAEHELQQAVRLLPGASRAQKTVTTSRLESAIEGVVSSRARLSELQHVDDER
jgi:hypothetical protein